MATSRKVINEIKEHVSIVDLAKDYFNITRKNGYLGIIGDSADGGDFSSLVIYPDTNTFFRQSNRHGGDVISFVQETQIEGIDNFKDAIVFLRQRIDPTFNIKTTYQKKKSYAQMSITEKAEKMRQCHETISKQLVIEPSYRNAMAYLIQERKIDPDIVREGFKKGEIAQVNMKGYKGVAFISKEMGLYSCVCKRGISRGSTFKGDYKGCNYDYGWRVFPDKAKITGIIPEAKIYCFEGYIDMLSFKSLMKGKKDLSNDIFIVCGSANKYKCVVNAVNDYRRDVVICFDNDKAGIELGNELKKVLEATNEKNEEKINVSQIYSKGKDWNDDLKMLSARNQNSSLNIHNHNANKLRR